MNKQLQDILMELAVANVGREHPTKIGDAGQAINNYILSEIIGDDELVRPLSSNAGESIHPIVRNQLRAEQRKRLGIQ